MEQRTLSPHHQPKPHSKGAARDEMAESSQGSLLREWHWSYTQCQCACHWVIPQPGKAMSKLWCCQSSGCLLIYSFPHTPPVASHHHSTPNCISSHHGHLGWGMCITICSQKVEWGGERGGDQLKWTQTPTQESQMFLMEQESNCRRAATGRSRLIWWLSKAEDPSSSR